MLYDQSTTLVQDIYKEYLSYTEENLRKIKCRWSKLDNSKIKRSWEGHSKRICIHAVSEHHYYMKAPQSLNLEAGTK